jgi:hypothetical protein
VAHSAGRDAIALLTAASLAACRSVPQPPESFQWPLPEITAADSTVVREIHISQDWGLAGAGPTIRISVDARGTHGDVYVTHWIPGSADDSEGVESDRTHRDWDRRNYGCRSFITTKNEAVCRVPFRRQPNWTRLVSRLDSLLATAPAPPPPVPNLVCTDGSGWELVDRQGKNIRRDATRFCGPGSPERKRYEDGVWQLLRGVNEAARRGGP